MIDPPFGPPPMWSFRSGNPNHDELGRFSSGGGGGGSSSSTHNSGGKKTTKKTESPGGVAVGDYVYIPNSEGTNQLYTTAFSGKVVKITDTGIHVEGSAGGYRPDSVEHFSNGETVFVMSGKNPGKRKV